MGVLTVVTTQELGVFTLGVHPRWLAPKVRLWGGHPKSWCNIPKNRKNFYVGVWTWGHISRLGARGPPFLVVYFFSFWSSLGLFRGRDCFLPIHKPPGSFHNFVKSSLKEMGSTILLGQSFEIYCHSFFLFSCLLYVGSYLFRTI